MGVLDRVRQLAAHWLMERPVRNRRIGELAADLKASGERVTARAMAANAGNEKNLDTMRHIIGIERWGQRRLRGFLGDAPPHDEYDAYRPTQASDMEALWTAFQSTRAETVNLARRIDEAAVPGDATVLHNGLGPLSARGWLRYLDVHARLESKRLR